jgi:hypothetical protein
MGWWDNHPEKKCCGIDEGEGSGGGLGNRSGGGGGEVGGAATVTVPVAAARLVAVDLYVSGRMLGLKENLDLMLLSYSFVVVGLVLLNDARWKERK